MTYLRINCYCITGAETWLATCKPYRGIFKRVCGWPSNCDSVWLHPVGSGTVTAPGKPKLRGQTSCLHLWVFCMFLILFIAPVSLSPPLSLLLVYKEKKSLASCAVCRLEWCHLLWFEVTLKLPLLACPSKGTLSIGYTDCGNWFETWSLTFTILKAGFGTSFSPHTALMDLYCSLQAAKCSSSVKTAGNRPDHTKHLTSLSWNGKEWGVESDLWSLWSQPQWPYHIRLALFVAQRALRSILTLHLDQAKLGLQSEWIDSNYYMLLFPWCRICFKYLFCIGVCVGVLSLSWA